MAQKKVSSDKEAYKSRGMKLGKGGNPGKPENHELPKPSELKKASKEKL